jgi:RHS repeat-associated protein
LKRKIGTFSSSKMGCLKLDISKNYEPLLRVVGKNGTTKKGVVNYYPFGSLMPGRNYSSNSYRYGWNKGSEKDDEITGITGSHITTYFREYDNRLGRTWSRDPQVIPWQTPYSSMNNNPIAYNDPLGDKIKTHDRKERKALKNRAMTDGYEGASGRAAWKRLKNDYRGNKRDLVVTQKKGHGYENFDKAEIQSHTHSGTDDRSTGADKVDHLYYENITEKVTKTFKFDNLFSGGTNTSPVNNYSYPNLRVGRDFTRGLFNYNIDKYLAKNSSATLISITGNDLTLKGDDQNFANPARYTFNLDGAGPFGAGSYVTTNSYTTFPLLGISLVTGNRINASEIRFTNSRGSTDSCHGFKLRLDVTLEKIIK